VFVCDVLAFFNILQGYTARIFPEKVPQISSETDSYFISNYRIMIFDARQE
jgi:hypothetical protein